MRPELGRTQYLFVATGQHLLLGTKRRTMRLLLGSGGLDLERDGLIVRVLQAQALRDFIVEGTY
jgi:hypothetical protein